MAMVITEAIEAALGAIEAILVQIRDGGGGGGGGLTQSQAQAAIEAAQNLNGVEPSLASLDTKTPALGPAAAVAATPVAIATDQIGAGGTGLAQPSGGSGILGYLSLLASSLLTRFSVPQTITDVASNAQTSSTTTSAFTPTWGASYRITIPVSASSGTNRTLDVTVQESPDDGATWVNRYQFRTITGNGTYQSRPLRFTGTRVRYLLTVGGTSPSFTRSILRTQINGDAYEQPEISRLGGFGLVDFAVPNGASIRRLLANNRTATPLFLQIHSKATALAAGDVPLNGESYPLEALGQIYLGPGDLGEYGSILGSNIRFGISSTFDTYTAAAASNNLSLFLGVSN